MVSASKNSGLSSSELKTGVMNTGKLSKLAAQLSILLIDCPDQKGLVHKITGAILDSNLNIVSNGEFVDQESNRFS